jgi:hypothetical protein
MGLGLSPDPVRLWQFADSFHYVGRLISSHDPRDANNTTAIIFSKSGSIVETGDTLNTPDQALVDLFCHFTKCTILLLGALTF